jgi:hypothetical protein
MTSSLGPLSSHGLVPAPQPGAQGHSHRKRRDKGTRHVRSVSNSYNSPSCRTESRFGRDHGEPSRAVKSAGAAKRNKWRGPRECSVDGGGGRLCRLRVTLDRAARRGLFPRGERPALGTRRLPRQDRKALRKPGFPFRKVGSRRLGLEPRKPGPGFADGVSY